MNDKENSTKFYKILKLGENQYNPVDVVEKFDEILDYFSKSKVNTNDLNLFNQFIDILWKNCNFDLALDAIEKALKKYPGDLDMEEKLAEVLLDAGEIDKAIEKFSKLHDEHPGYYQMLEGLGYAYQKKGDLEKAEGALLQALEMETWDPSHLMAQFEMMEQLARIYYYQKKFKLALEFLDEILTVQPRSSKWQLYFKTLKKLNQKDKLREARKMYQNVKKGRRYASRAARYEAQNKYELALKNYRKAIAANPLEPHYYFCVGNVLESLPEDEYEFQFDEATAYYRTAVEMFPNNMFYQLAYVGNLINVHEWEKAFETARSAAEKFPELMLPNLRYLAENLGYEKEFVDLLRHLIELDPDRKLSEIRTELAIILKERGEKEEAEKYFEEASNIYQEKIKLHPYNWRNYYDYGSCKLEVSQLDEAREFLIKALEYHGDFSEIIAEKLSRTFYELEQFEDARILLEALIVSSPGNYEYLGRIGMCFLVNEDYEKAFEAFNRSILLNRNVPEYLYGAGVSAAHLNKTEDVINIIKDLLEMDDEFIEVIEEEPAFNNMKGKEEFFKLVDRIKKQRKQKPVKPAIKLKKLSIPSGKTREKNDGEK